MKRSNAIKLMLFFVLCVMLFMVTAAFAQTAPAPAGTAPVAQTANVLGRIVAIAGIVFTLLQAVKQFLPVTGPIALVANIVLSIVGVIVAVQPDQLLSLNTLFAVLAAAAGAAGFHGTWSKLSAPSTP